MSMSKDGDTFSHKNVHFATHETHLTHGLRKLRLAEDFEMLCLEF